MTTSQSAQHAFGPNAWPVSGHTGLLALTVGPPGSLAGVDSDDAVRALEGERTQGAVRIRADGDGIAQIARTLGVGASSVSRALAKKDRVAPPLGRNGGLICQRDLMDER